MRDIIVKIPFVLAIAEWVWGGHDSTVVSPDICLEHVPFMMSSPCLKQLIAKGLGVAIILGACLNKAPIILNIYNAKSAAGLSQSSMYGELLVCLNSALYGWLEGYPFTAYGESIAIVIQTIIIILMMWKYSSQPPGNKSGGGAVSFTEQVLATTFLIAYITIVVNFLPKQNLYLLMASVWPLLLYSRGTQIWETFQIQHTGAQSIVTTSMNLVGSSIRILTTLQEVGMDVAVISGYALGILTSSIMVIQYIYYQKNTETFLKERKKQD